MSTKALQEALEKWDVEKFLREEKVAFKDSPGSDELIMDCPHCEEEGKTDKLWINKQKKIGYCYYCDESWSAVRIVMEFAGLNYFETLKLLMRNRVVSYSADLDKAVAEVTAEEEEVIEQVYELPKAIRLPKEFIPVTASTPAPKYMLDRGISTATAMMYKLGWCISGYFKGRMIMPFYVKGRLISYSARDMTGKAEKKYLYPKGAPTGKGIFNYDRIKEYDRIYLTEGCIDAITSGRDVGALGGKSLTMHQNLLLAEAAPSEVVFMFDGDEAGREATIKCAEKVAGYTTPLCIFTPWGKDPDQIDDIDALKAEPMTLDEFKIAYNEERNKGDNE